MPRRKKADIEALDGGPVEEERHEDVNSAARAETIREVCEQVGELDRQIDGIKADLGMKSKHFAAAYKLYQMPQDERDTLQDTIRECFRALAIGEQSNWLDAAG